MRRIAAQLLQVRTARFLWVCLGACLAVLGFLAFQFTMNSGSGFLDDRAKSPAVVSTLFLWLLAALLGTFPAVLVGSYLGGKDEVGRTQANLVHAGGRLPTLGAKVGALLVVSIIVTVIVWAWGSVLGAAASAGRATAPLFGENLGAQLAIVVTVLFLTGLLALTVSTVTRSVVLGNVIAFTVLLGQQFIPGVLGQTLQWVNPFAYVQAFTLDVFTELSQVSAVTVAATTVTAAEGFMWGAACVALQVVVLVVLSARREVSA